jgi:phosphonate transport system ATP-binding protein
MTRSLAASPTPSAIDIRDLTKSFRGGKRALALPHLTIAPGEMVALIGASGSGKSTLLRHIAGLTLADRASGTISVHGRMVQRRGRGAGDLRAIRCGIGFVFQQFNLVDRLPVLVNVLTGALARVPLWRSLSGWFTAAERRRALEALERVGIADCALQRASTLSGGQQQRAAIARALLQGARVLLADEPIASLDPESSRRIMEILQRINREDGITVLISLHQVEMATRYCRRIVALKAGEIIFDGAPAALTPALLADIYDGDSVAPPEASRPKPALWTGAEPSLVNA